MSDVWGPEIPWFVVISANFMAFFRFPDKPVYTHIYIHVYLCVYIYIYIYMCIYVYKKHIFICILAGDWIFSGLDK